MDDHTQREASLPSAAYEPVVRAIQEQTRVLHQLVRLLTSDQPAVQADYLTVRQAARLLQRTPKTIRNWIAAGKLAAVKLNQDRYLIPKESVTRLCRPSELQRAQAGGL